MKLVTSQQMQALDRTAIEKHSIPSLVLMERAGCFVAEEAKAIAASRKGSIVILSGRGNNGGDGLVAARSLIEHGFDVSVFLLSRPSELSPDSRANWERLAPMTTHIYEISTPADLRVHHPVLAGASVIIDAIFGTGLMRKVEGAIAEVIDYINALKRPLIAVDVPSGLSSDTGMPLGSAIRATHTVTFGLPKLGLYIGAADEFAGHITVADIGIPAEEVDKIDSRFQLTDDSMIARLLPKRQPTSHKGTYGHVAVIAGASGKLGAGYLTSMAALRTGAGLVTYYLPESAFEKFDARYPEIMCEPVPDKGRGHFHPDGVGHLLKSLSGKSVMALGPAIGTHDETRAFERELIASLTLPLVIDADGINNLDPEQVRRKHLPCVITPHPGEFAKLSGISTEKQINDRFALAVTHAQKFGVHLVLKGYHTIIASPDGSAFINPTGGPAMASAGMGDALTGMIAGFIAQGIEPKMASVAGVYLHGLAGDIAAKEIGDRGIVASDVIKRVPQTMRSITSSPL